MPAGNHSNCLVCRSEKLRPMHGFEAHHLVKCHDCGFVFSRSIPTKAELDAVYEGYGRNDYLSDLTVQVYERLLDSFEPYRKTNRLIDVGCGIGYFLEVAKRKGWEVYGTEFTEEAVKICEGKGISMQVGPLNTTGYEPESFDIVASFEVIEHINDPLAELGKFRELLRPGGMVYCTTPNFNAVERFYLKADWNVIAYPEHLSYYSPSTLKRVFKESGFSAKKIETTGISITRIKKSQGRSDQATISATSDDEQLRNRIASNPLLGAVKSTVNVLLTFFGIGNSLKGRFIKR